MDKNIQAEKINKQNQKNIKSFNKLFKGSYWTKQNTKSGIEHFNQLPNPKPILFVENLF